MGFLSDPFFRIKDRKKSHLYFILLNSAPKNPGVVFGNWNLAPEPVECFLQSFFRMDFRLVANCIFRF
jgi:hypothetical protein